ncbi:MAG: hypothetical protein AAFY29_01045 [Pseudomonadota bacterium]
MLNEIALKEIVANPEVSQKDKVLACLATNGCKPKKVAVVRDTATSAGLSGAKKLNISSILSGRKGLAINTPAGWELTLPGKGHVKQLGGGPVVQLSGSLRSLLPNIASNTTQAFVQEAIECVESRHYRASVVLSWVGAVSVLYDHVIANRLADFNAHARKMDPKWKDATNSDDLAKMKEANFLTVCESASIIGKSVKQELEGCLRFRNGCGHPNSLKLGENRVAGHIETLITNVYSVF